MGILSSMSAIVLGAIFSLLLAWTLLLIAQGFYCRRELKKRGFTDVRAPRRMSMRITPAPGWSVVGVYAAKFEGKDGVVCVMHRSWRPFSLGINFDSERRIE